MEGPVLFCVGASPPRARVLVRAADALLVRRPAVTVSVWKPFHASHHGLGATLSLLAPPAELNATLRERAQQAADAAAEELRDLGWSVQPRAHRSDQPPWRALLALAAELGASAIVAGHNDVQDLPHGALGRQARGLAHDSQRSLLMIPPDVPDPGLDDPVFVAYDGSPSAERAIEAATAVLAPRPAVIACAWRSVRELAPMALAGIPGRIAADGADEIDGSARAGAHDIGMRAAGALRLRGRHTHVVTPQSHGSAWPALVEAADDAGAAVIVVGARNRSRVSQALLGSVAEGVLRHARRPVLLVPAS